MRATVTSKGQVTIPKEIRTSAHINCGMQLDFQITKNGTITLRPLTNHISHLKGIVKKKPSRPITSKSMKESIIDAAQETMK